MEKIPSEVWKRFADLLEKLCASGVIGLTLWCLNTPDTPLTPTAIFFCLFCLMAFILSLLLTYISVNNHSYQIQKKRSTRKFRIKKKIRRQNV